jgi:hypothetical protein|tara:strand:+ start:1955 stop:2323 length:369 start_codon:yes stop_codon:yes gene_type:complete
MNDNKIIAEFMGGEFNSKHTSVTTKEGFNSVGALRYHTSWDWLMPVVDKIRRVISWDRDKFSTDVTIYGNGTQIVSGCYGSREHSDKYFNQQWVGKNGYYNTLENTYSAVVNYIKWYNSQKR